MDRPKPDRDQLALAALALATALTLTAPDRTTAQQEHTVATAREALASMTRPGGSWVTSNATYWTEAGSEPREYAMKYELVPGGLAMQGCMWGIDEGEILGPYWYFTHAWDPTENALLHYQVSPGGAVAIGHGRRTEDGTDESVQSLVWPGQAPVKVRHVNRRPDEDTIDSRSFHMPAGEDEWQPRREYIWVWTPNDAPDVCRDALDRR